MQTEHMLRCLLEGGFTGETNGRFYRNGVRIANPNKQEKPTKKAGKPAEPDKTKEPKEAEKPAAKAPAEAPGDTAAWKQMARNPRRKELAEQGQQEVARLKASGLLNDAQSVHVIGSMAGKKEHPGDIDMVVLVDRITPEQRRWNREAAGLHTGDPDPIISNAVASAKLPVNPDRKVQVFFGTKDGKKAGEFDYAREVQDYFAETRRKYGAEPVQVYGEPMTLPKESAPAETRKAAKPKEALPAAAAKPGRRLRSRKKTRPQAPRANWRV